MGPHRMPAAEVDVSPDLVRRLLVDQHPDLAHLPVEVIANGWDNVMCRVGEALVARLPRREVAAILLVNDSGGSRFSRIDCRCAGGTCQPVPRRSAR